VVSTTLRMNSSSPIIPVTFSTTRMELSQEAKRNFSLCRDSFNTRLEQNDSKIDFMRYGLNLRVPTILTTDRNVSRYCVPMDNQRPSLDMKYFKDICPDQNGVSLQTVITTIDTSL